MTGLSSAGLGEGRQDTGANAHFSAHRLDWRVLRRLRHDPISILPIEVFREPRVDLRLLWRQVTVISDPVVIQQVLGQHSDHYGLTSLQKRLLQPSVGNGVILKEGVEWAQDRRRSLKLASFVTQNAAAGAVERLGMLDREVSGAASAGYADLFDVLVAAALDLLSITLFDRADAIATPQRVQRLQAHKSLVERFELFDLLGLPTTFATRRTRRMHDLCHYEDKTVVAAARRSSGLLGEYAAGMTDAQIRDFVISLLSGYESIALTAFWTLVNLARHDEVLEDVRRAPPMCFQTARIAGGSALERAMGETLRMYPTFPLLFRRVLRDHATRAGKIRRGATVLISPYILHRHQCYWAEPGVFRPDRFGGATPQAFMPFGIGARRCVGMRLGIYVSGLIVQHLLKSHTPVEVDPAAMRPRIGLSLRPGDPAGLVLRPRESVRQVPSCI